MRETVVEGWNGASGAAPAAAGRPPLESLPPRNGTIWILTLAFLALALASRFYRLGWSFSGDETSFFDQVHSLLEEPFFLKNPDGYQAQARANPVGYWVMAGSYAVFGQSEVGARTGSVLAGALSIGMAVLLVGRLFGTRPAAITGLLLLLWPWHLGESQSTRMYQLAFLFGSASLLLAAWGWRRNTALWGAVAGVASALAVSTHNLAMLIPASLGLFAASEAVLHRRTFAGRAVVGYAAVGGPLLLASSALAWRMMRGWVVAVTEDWGGGLSSLMGLVYGLGWEVALVAVVGWLGAWFSKDPVQRMLAITAAVAVLACAVLPRFVPFRQEYVYSSSICFMILAGLALARFYDIAAARSKMPAVGLVAAVVLSSLPAFASNYMDGDHKDYRAAAEYIRAHMREGDLLASDVPGVLGHYLHREVVSAGRPSTQPRMMVDVLTGLKKSGARVWYVCRYAREEPAAWADTWLWENAVRMLRIKKKRFDYHENILDVYVLNKTASPGDGNVASHP